MTDPSLTLQKLVRARLAGTQAVTDQVPAGQIVDTSRHPNVFPAIILGEGQTVLESEPYSRRVVRCYLDLHAWTKGDDLAGVKTITGVITDALKAPFWSDEYRVADFLVSSVRFLRDPTREYAHAVVTVEALLLELNP